MGRPVFGVDRDPGADGAPAWILPEPVPEAHVGKPDVGISQFMSVNGDWHWFSHVAKARYVARCGAVRRIINTPTRIKDAPTCRRRGCS